MNPYKIIVRPVSTEKSNIASELGQYTFIVDRAANKLEIAEAISYIFNVDVVKVPGNQIERPSSDGGAASVFGASRL